MSSETFDSIRNSVLKALEERAPQHGVDIVDVEVVGAMKAPTVRVRIDHLYEESGPISLDEVSEQTSWISNTVDEMDPIEGHFTLEVSSPGVARPLRKQRDFERFAGEDVSLSLRRTEGRRRFTGRLEGIEDGEVRITTDEGPFSFRLEDIRSCSIKPNYDEIAKSAKDSIKKSKR